MKEFFYRHSPAIAVSILIGLAIIGPQLLFIHSLGSSYKGIYMAKTDAELHYVARMQESLKGDGMGDPYILDYRNDFPSTTYSYEETILALPARVFPVTVMELNLIYKFLLPMIIALLAYALLYRMMRSRLWAITGTIILLLGPTLVNLPDVLHLIRWQQVYGEFLLYSRPANPELSSILFLTYLHFLLSGLENNKRRWFIGLCILFAASFYIYFYSATFFLALNTVFILLTLIQKRYRIALYLLLVQIGGLILGWSSILAIYTIYKSPYYPYLSGESHILSSHAPLVSIAGIITAILFLLFYLKNRSYDYAVFLGGLLVTTFLVINQQIVTGIVLQEGHYHWYFNTPIFIIILILVAHQYIPKMKYGIGIMLAVLICLMSCTEAYLIQSSSYNEAFASTKAEQKYIPMLDWLRDNTPTDSVVMANNTISELIPVYTNDDVVWQTYAANYLLPPARRAFTTDALVNSPNLQETLAMSPYKVEYFVWDTSTDPQWKFSKNTFLKKVYGDGEFQIYEK